MDKRSIIETLKTFPYDPKDYWIITGSAMVMHGIREKTHDIDLGCSARMADALERDGFLCRISEDGNRCFRYGQDIEIFENWLFDGVIDIDGFQTISIQGLQEMKKSLGREKDLKDIGLIEEYLNRNTVR